MSFHSRALAILAGVALAAGCGDPATTPTDLSHGSADPTTAKAQSGDAGATASWNELATSLADRTAIDQGRLYAYLSLAQFRAAELAANEGGERRNFHAFRHQYRERLGVSAAIGGAIATA